MIITSMGDQRNLWVIKGYPYITITSMDTFKTIASMINQMLPLYDCYINGSFYIIIASMGNQG